MKHILKIETEYFRAKQLGLKSWEYRINDRFFQIGDTLILQDNFNGHATGREIEVHILYIYDCNNGYVILSDDSNQIEE